jgi:glycolate oxidase iron-sulfur subunit
VGGRVAVQTSFTLTQLADPNVAESEKILRACVHCGFCTATCPTYVLDGNELDSPRGRIYLIKDMLENDRPATADVALHIDRCLSCLACMTTCPSGVHYMHLVDHARVYIERTYERPLIERLMRAMLAKLMPYPQRFRLALGAALIAKPFATLAQGIGMKRLAAMLRLAPWRVPRRPLAPRTFSALGSRKHGRVALLAGCVNDVLAPQINAAALRVLTRLGIEVVVAEGAGCCGSLVHHMGREDEALGQARANIAAWSAIEGLDAVLTTTSGCGTTMKDYGFMFRTDPAYAERAAHVAGITKDITEYLASLSVRADRPSGLVVAYHSACSLQHGQRVTRQVKDLLATLGFVVKDVPDGHLCCGSAGTYNILQPDIARRLRERKVGTIERLRPDVIAAGNIGCMMQIAAGTKLPAVHTVELIDWATGGPCPPALWEHQRLAVHPSAAAD